MVRRLNKEGYFILLYFFKNFCYNIYIIKKEVFYMKLREWLDKFDAAGLLCTIWFADDCSPEPEFKGFVTDIPYWIINCPLATEECLRDNSFDVEVPIFYCTIDDRPGIQIILM
jgi:hypothetical protein